MIQPINRMLGTYNRRLAMYAISTTAFSAMGSTFTWVSEEWAAANPVISGPLGALSLMPALAIAAIVDVRWLGAALTSAIAALAVVTFWWVFAFSGSSTASFVFFWGVIAGVPIALVEVIAVNALRRSKY